MKAIILAAGKGERLRGIIDKIPKPMVGIEGKPILEHNIEWIRDYGIRDVSINLHYLPDVIKDYFKDGSKWGVKITYSYEPELFGTAGAVRKITEECWRLRVNDYSWFDPGDNRKRIADTSFLVIYGDNLFEYNLREITNFHKKKEGMATIAVYEKDDVSQSGIVLLDSDNKILKFLEKPKPDKVVSHLVNAGLYILELDVLNYIPLNKGVDFGKDVFPEMIRKGESIFGIIVKGKLTAIDTPELLGKVISHSQSED